MKIKNICVIAIYCILSLSPAISNADELYTLAKKIDPANTRESRDSAQDTPSDIVTTEVIGGSINNSNTNASGNINIATESGTKDIRSKTNNKINSKKNKTSDVSSVTTASDDAIGGILIQAMSLMGISYKWGGNTPATGMDCSGFIRYVFQKSMGITLPRTAAEMSKVGVKVSPDDIQPGDLIFFNTIGGRRNTHIGMYIGNNQFIQSPRTGEKIQITDYNAYWRSHTNGIKRIVRESIDEDGNTNVENLDDVRNQALPSGYIKGKHASRRNRSRSHVSRRHIRTTSTARTKKPVKSKKHSKVR